jgi:hypothetical protein
LKRHVAVAWLVAAGRLNRKLRARPPRFCHLEPNKVLQQPAAAMLVSDSSLSLNAVAAVERGRSAPEA